MAREGMLWFVLYVVAFALGIASFIISVLSAASYTTIGALLSIAVFCLGFAGISFGRDNIDVLATSETALIRTCSGKYASYPSTPN